MFEGSPNAFCGAQHTPLIFLTTIANFFQIHFQFCELNKCVPVVCLLYTIDLIGKSHPNMKTARNGSNMVFDGGWVRCDLVWVHFGGSLWMSFEKLKNENFDEICEFESRESDSRMHIRCSSLDCDIV